MGEIIAEFFEVFLGTLLGIGLIIAAFTTLYIGLCHIDYWLDKTFKSKSDMDSRNKRRRS